MLRRVVVALVVVACASACGVGVGARDESTTPAAMVGLPSPLVTSALAPSPPPSDPAPPIGTTTRVIADAPPQPQPHRGRRIDLDVKGADIHDVLRLLADVGRVNIVVADDVQGSLTLRMRQVPWDQALDVIVRVRGLFAERDGNVIIVSAKPH
jgi:hypothetical protein